MRQKVFIILTILIVVVLLIALNVASYVSEEQSRESELTPNRSTYHSGPTGLRAFYDFLSESGYPVMRWREKPDQLLNSGGQQVQTFVVVGRTQLEFDEEQAKSLLQWVSRGGRLILIDRTPEGTLLPKSGAWKIVTSTPSFAGFGADPTNVEAMTANVTPFAPAQPTLLTLDVTTVMPSRLATRIEISADPKETEAVLIREDETNEEDEEGSPKGGKTPVVAESTSPAPVTHLGDLEGALLVDYRHGLGRIMLLSDPYIVANNGIRLGDNLRLALNMVTASDGLIAFDEYHQGRGITENALIAYFRGTPVLALCGQGALLVLLLLWTKGRRFARPLPLVEIDRRSKLEFVASMAELQERARAFDLAIENIYSRTRRVLARYAGVDYNSPRSEIAARVASRSNIDGHRLETLMRQCEETINGAPVTWRQSIDMVRRLREIESSLGLGMRSRDVRQAAESI